MMHSADPPETEDLRRFREDWKAELRKKADTTSDKALQDAQQPSPSSSTIAGAPLPPTTSAVNSPAVDIYRRAVQLEQQSQLDDALRLYRQAFRIDPSVDRTYHQQELIAALLQPPPLPAKQTKPHIVASAPVHRVTRSVITTSQTLATLVAGFPTDLGFVPEDPILGVLLSMLPDEVIVLILRRLDACNVERFAAVCRKARVVSLDSGIWRNFAERAYQEPVVLRDLASVVDAFQGDYRRLYIEQPRVRMDGVYIAVCHYVAQAMFGSRPGISENAWVNISHLITYHRYLRFLPTGQVLSLLTNDELNPKEVIHLLKPSLRMKGLFIGSWYLDETTVYIRNLFDASGKFSLPLHSHTIDSLSPFTPISPPSSSFITNHLPTPSHTTASLSSSRATNAFSSASARYIFQMTLTLRSRPAGRWNRLDLAEYDSVNVESGEAVPVALQRERPFWFSRVRSWD